MFYGHGGGASGVRYTVDGEERGRDLRFGSQDESVCEEVRKPEIFGHYQPRVKGYRFHGGDDVHGE